DGNGRLARLLTNLRLMRAGFPPIVLQRRIRKSYYDALEKADDGDLTQFAALVARDVGSALDLWLEAAA
ncbi:cell filamentation protein Fic, partial [Candidatus Micrarchaeota archaeon CG_4_10_14_0_8_um_filter_60_7]